MNFVVIAIIFIILGGLLYKKNDIYIALRGAQGLKGLKGDTGLQGAQGIPGIRGATGETGAIGSQGVPGVPGPIGVTGLQGLKGATGSQGEIGAQGKIGPQGLVGPVGAPGPRGNIGPQGVPGEKGDIGEMGKVGQNGPRGIAGPVGPLGPVGAVGKTGPLGKLGPVGPQGIPGAPGLGFTDKIRSLIAKQVKPYFSGQNCEMVSALRGRCPPNHFMSGLRGLTPDGRITSATQMQCCYGIGNKGPTVQAPTPQGPIRLAEEAPGMPVRGKIKEMKKPTIKEAPGMPVRQIKKKYVTIENYVTPFSAQTASNPNVLAANIKNMDLAARGLQLRNYLGTGRQTLVTTGNRPIISGGGNVLRIGANKVSPALADRIRIAGAQNVPLSYLGTGR